MADILPLLKICDTFLCIFLRAYFGQDHQHNYVQPISPIESLPSIPRTRWWFQLFFIFTPIWGRFPIWRSYFSDGLKPPTRECKWAIFCNPPPLDGKKTISQMLWSKNTSKRFRFQVQLPGLTSFPFVYMYLEPQTSTLKWLLGDFQFSFKDLESSNWNNHL